MRDKIKFALLIVLTVIVSSYITTGMFFFTMLLFNKSIALGVIGMCFDAISFASLAWASIKL